MRAVALATIAALTIATASAAQQETIGQHYHAYNAALQSGDVVTAEREAAAALQLSEAQDGEGGHTAVLALNLATTRLSRGDAGDALQPALKAYSLAQSNPGSGVDVALARLVETHAALAAGNDAAASQLSDAIEVTRSHSDWVADVNAASVDLALWQFGHQHFREARAAWQFAAQSADGSPLGADVALAYADIGIGGAILTASSQSGIRRDDALAAREAPMRASATFFERMRYVELGAPLSPSLKEYALAQAWMALLRDEIDASELRLPEAANAPPSQRAVDLVHDDPRPFCEHRMMQTPLPQYPPHANDNRHIGTVVVFFQTDESGRFVRTEVAAEVGSEFSQSVMAVVPQWRIEKAAGAAAGCRLSTQGFLTFHYRQ